MPNLYMGVDPGFKSGGIVVVDSGGNVVDSARLSHLEVADQGKLIMSHSGSDVVAVLEAVAARPGQGVSSMFKFGKGTGRLEMALSIAGIPYEELTPQRWQKAYGIPAGVKKEKRKRALKAVAQRLFPAEPIVLENADAYLLAEYARTAGRWAISAAA